MSFARAGRPRASTRIECERTNGVGVRDGVRVLKWCPYCGRRTMEGDQHTVTVTIPEEAR